MSDEIEKRLSDEEKYCYDTIQMLREAYDKAAAPYFKRLCDIQNMRIPVMRVTAEQYAMLQEFRPLERGR